MSVQKIARYKIERELGRGGMAIVYLAHDPNVKRTVAVKVLPRQFTFEPQFRTRFRREAELVAALDHPAIVPIFDFGEYEEQPYIVMRYMPGGSLAERIQRGPLSLAEAAQILDRIAPALDEAHAQNIIHRDLKPDNILFDQRDKPYLADFGIAKLMEGQETMLTASGGTVGTPAYMSPEQVQGHIVIDGRSDIYALGIILFEMLTGSRPYYNDTPMRLAMMHVLEPVPRIRGVNPNLPPDCETVIGRALAKDREERYPTAVSLATAVSQLAARHENTPETVVLPPEFAQPRGGLAQWLGFLSPSRPEETPAAPAPELESLPADTLPAIVTGEATGEQAGENGQRLWLKPFTAGLIAIGLLLPLCLLALWLAGDRLLASSPPDTAIADVLLAVTDPTVTPTLAPPSPTVASTLSATPTIANTPTVTPTPDPNLPPVEAQLGDTWIRPIDGMVMVYVPAPVAPFTLRSDLAAPMESYWIDKYEVTNVQYQLCVDAGVCEPSELADDSRFNEANQPVMDVTWFDAAAYAAWVGGALPTEEEWEYAAAGEAGTEYPWGDEFDGTRLNFCDVNCSHEWKDSAWDDGYRYTAPVGSYPDGESWVGAADMAGNVWEWTDSWFDGSQTGRVVRGGSWQGIQIDARAAYRDLSAPGSRLGIGFRVVAHRPPSP